MSFLHCKNIKGERGGEELCGGEISFTHFKLSQKVKSSSQFDQRKNH